MNTQFTKRALLSKQAFGAGLGIGAWAMLAPAQRVSADVPFTSFPFTATGAPTARTMPDRLAEIVNVKDWGAAGNGVNDDTAAIQAAFNAAFGPPSSPHGNANKYLNKPVFFPPGNYIISSPLYLVGVMGVHILGAGSQCTVISYTGSYNGNTVVGNGITPVIMTNGFAYSRLEGLGFVIGNNNSTCLYIFQDGTRGQTNGNTFADIAVGGCTAGILVGYQSNALCSENLFLNCFASSCAGYGFRNVSSNALNNNFVGCSAASCGVGFSCPTGSIQMQCASLAGNGTDITTGQNPMTIIGSRTESANFIDTTASSGVTHFVAGCIQAAGAGAGYFINLGGANYGVIDACHQESSNSTDGLISGTSGSKVYLRGCVFANKSYISSFTGTVAQNI